MLSAVLMTALLMGSLAAPITITNNPLHETVFTAQGGIAGVDLSRLDPREPSSLLEVLGDVVHPNARVGLQSALDREAAEVAAAHALAAAPSLESLLRTLIQQHPESRFTPSNIPALQHFDSLEQALQALADIGGNPLTDLDLARISLLQQSLPLELQADIMDLSAHLVVGIQLRTQAFANVEASDMLFLAHGLGAADLTSPMTETILADRLDASASGTWATSKDMGTTESAASLLQGLGIDANGLQHAARNVDFGALTGGAAVILQGIDEALPSLRSMEGLQRSVGIEAASVGILAPPPPGACAGLAPALLVVPGVLMLGFGGPEAFGTGPGTDVLLSIDLGGNDAYCNNAGSTQASGGDILPQPACDPALPVGIAIDVGGNDAYHSTYAGLNTDDTSANSIECFEGAGELGIGILVDLAGDDSYNSGKVLVDTPAAGCPAATASGGPGGATLDSSVAQGGASTGVGILADFSGNDAYTSFNTLCSTTSAWVQMSSSVSQGAAANGVGILADFGAGNNAFNSANQMITSGGTGNAELYSQLNEGAAITGIGALVSTQADDQYDSGNVEVASPTSGWGSTNLQVVCTQGCGGILFGLGGPGNVGVLLDLLGDDRHTCENIQTSPITAPISLFFSDANQGFGSLQSQGSLVDLEGNDCYGSRNSQTSGVNIMFFLESQGAGESEGSGILVDFGGRQDYISDNIQTGGATFRSDYGVAYNNWLNVDRVQGSATMGNVCCPIVTAAVGMLVNVNAGNGDRYVSDNVQTSTNGKDVVDILFSQGYASQATGLGSASGTMGVLLDMDTGSTDSYNANNLGGASGGIVIYGVQGASGDPRIFGTAPGTAIMVDVGGSNNYNTGNGHAAFGGCVTFPLSAASSCIDWTNGESTGLPVGLFVDLSPPVWGPDAYIAPFLSYGWDMYGFFPGSDGVCIDAVDGPDVTAGTCLDL